MHDVIHADERPGTSTCLDTYADGDPGLKINNKKYICPFSSSSAVDNQFKRNNYDEEIIACKFTELDASESNDDEEKLRDRRRCRKLTINEDIQGPPKEIKKNCLKYYLNRYELFNRYDEGIQLDEGKFFYI